MLKRARGNRGEGKEVVNRHRAMYVFAVACLRARPPLAGVEHRYTLGGHAAFVLPDRVYEIARVIPNRTPMVLFTDRSSRAGSSDEKNGMLSV